MNRKLASIRRISGIKPIDGADNIECIIIDGWQLVTQKSNNFKVGDLVIYFEIDSFLPIKPEFEFLRKGCYRNTPNLGEGFRIKTIKLRGQVSQGLALPIEEFLTHITPQEGDDLTEILGVRKYEVPIPTELAGKVKGNFPSFIPKTDSERAQNLINDIWLQYMDEPFEVTVKLDGSSMTCYHNEDYFGVCSRNLDIIEDESNSFWRIANKLKLQEILNDISSREYDLALQGELVGPGVQKNKEKLTELNFYIFNVYKIKSARFLSPLERKAFIEGINKLGYNIVHVPVLIEKTTLNELLGNPTKEELMKKLIEFSKGSMMNGQGHREGVVFKHHNSDFNFKVINPDFLLKYDE